MKPTAFIYFRVMAFYPEHPGVLVGDYSWAHKATVAALQYLVENKAAMSCASQLHTVDRDGSVCFEVTLKYYTQADVAPQEDKS